MDFLINFAAENAEIREIDERARGLPGVQGLVLDIDPFWLSTWQLTLRFGREAVSRWLRDRYDWPFPFRPRFWPDFDTPRPQPFHYPRPLTIADLENWRPYGWENYCSRHGVSEDALPLVVRVCLSPQGEEDARLPDVSTFERKERRLRVEIETRPIARLAGNPRKLQNPIIGGISAGVSGSTSSTGTLGVILTAHDGKRYGLTCSHVVGDGQAVQHPAAKDSSSAVGIGQSVLSTALTPCDDAADCNAFATTPGHELDLSLIELNANSVTSALEVLDIGPVATVAKRASISTGQVVEVMGRTTKYSRLQVGPVTIWYKLKIDDNHYCFRNLFEVLSPYVGMPSIKLGDSGAAVCVASDAGTAWAGIIVGSDGDRGFALYSETAQMWLKAQGFDLLPA